VQDLDIQTNNIEKIYATYMSNGETERYLIQNDQPRQIAEMFDILSAVSYSREYINKYKGSISRVRGYWSGLIRVRNLHTY